MHDVLINNRVVVNTGSGDVIVQFPPRHAQGVGATPGSTGSGAPAGASSAPVSPVSTAPQSVPPPVTAGPALRGTGT
jgi:hypothetical protein